MLILMKKCIKLPLDLNELTEIQSIFLDLISLNDGKLLDDLKKSLISFLNPFWALIKIFFRMSINRNCARCSHQRVIVYSTFRRRRIYKYSGEAIDRQDL